MAKSPRQQALFEMYDLCMFLAQYPKINGVLTHTKDWDNGDFYNHSISSILCRYADNHNRQTCLLKWNSNNNCRYGETAACNNPNSEKRQWLNSTKPKEKSRIARAIADKCITAGLKL